jgi:hypothetical protein
LRQRSATGRIYDEVRRERLDLTIRGFAADGGNRRAVRQSDEFRYAAISKKLNILLSFDMAPRFEFKQRARNRPPAQTEITLWKWVEARALRTQVFGSQSDRACAFKVILKAWEKFSQCVQAAGEEPMKMPGLRSTAPRFCI